MLDLTKFDFKKKGQAHSQGVAQISLSLILRNVTSATFFKKGMPQRYMLPPASSPFYLRVISSPITFVHKAYFDHNNLQ